MGGSLRRGYYPLDSYACRPTLLPPLLVAGVASLYSANSLCRVSQRRKAYGGILQCNFSVILVTHDGSKHAQAFHYIYALAFSDLLFALKMFITACLRVGGFSEEWMEANDPWCYISAIVGQLGALTAMGWSFAIIVDLLIITFYPSRYATKESRRFGLAHALIWMTATCSIIPALSTGSIGLSPDGTCWMLGPYIWAFWGFWFIFVAFALGAIAAIFWKLSREGRADDSCAASQPHVKVVTQLSLITLVFFLNWVWNGVFQMMLFSNQQAEKRWLVAIQVCTITNCYVRT